MWCTNAKPETTCRKQSWVHKRYYIKEKLYVKFDAGHAWHNVLTHKFCTKKISWWKDSIRSIWIHSLKFVFFSCLYSHFTLKISKNQCFGIKFLLINSIYSVTRIYFFQIEFTFSIDLFFLLAIVIQDFNYYYFFIVLFK